MKLLKTQRLALYLFFFSINFEVWDPFNTGGFFSVSKLTGFLYLMSILPDIYLFFKKKKINKFLKPIFVFFTLLTIVGLFNISFSSYSFFEFTIFQNIIVFWVLMNHERKDPMILEKGMFVFALGSIFLALFYQMDIGVSYSEDNRVTIFGDNENYVGIRMSISIIILLVMIIQNTINLSRWRYLYFITIPIMFLLLIETASRVALFALISSFFIGAFLMKTNGIGKKIFFLIFALALGIYLWTFIMQSELLMNRLLSSFEGNDLSGRDDIWKTLIPLIEKNPLFGSGITGYESFSIRKFGKFESPHNVFIEILAYVGIIGLYVYLTFLFRLINNAISYYLKSGFLLPLLLFSSIFGFLLSGQLLGVKMGWIIFAYIGSKIFYYEPDYNFNK